MILLARREASYPPVSGKLYSDNFKKLISTGLWPFLAFEAWWVSRGNTGGVYLWKEKAHAEKWHGAEFRKKVKEIYGAEPESQFFETPIVVDNLAGEIAKD